MARPSAKDKARPSPAQYVAGLLDRNGIVFSPARPLVQTSYRPVCEMLMEVYGGQLTEIRGNNKLQYAWTLDNEEMINFVTEIGPWMDRSRPRAYKFLTGNGRTPDFEPDETPY
jgi:hypothetical protein